MYHKLIYSILIIILLSSCSKKETIELNIPPGKEKSFEIYKESISENLNNGKLKEIQIAYSKETNSSYVQDLIIKNEGLVVDSLKNEGVIMICGSVNMQKEVIDVLSEISINKLKNPLSEYENMEQIKMDCY